MIEPELPDDEAERQAALERYEILDTLPERAYDDITALMAEVCEAPVSLVGLIDRNRNWLKSHHGVPMSESPRAISFCGHAIVSGQELFTVEDARQDPRFADNPLVAEHAVVSYAGAPLIDADGFALGTLCMFDTRPRLLTDGQEAALKNMARHVMYLLERHLRERRLERSRAELRRRNEDLAHFAGAVSHDIRGPVTNITALLDLIGEDVRDERVRADLRMLHRSSSTLLDYIDGLTCHYTADSLTARPMEDFALADLFAAVDSMLPRGAGHVAVTFADTAAHVRCHRAALQQILLNLVGNAIKYGHGEGTRVEIGFDEIREGYRFTVTDNGPGIAVANRQRIFDLFGTGDAVDRDGTRGTGIGLATVKRLLDRLGGTIRLDSAPHAGAAFTVTLPAPRA